MKIGFMGITGAWKAQVGRIEEKKFLKLGFNFGANPIEDKAWPNYLEIFQIVLGWLDIYPLDIVFNLNN